MIRLVYLSMAAIVFTGCASVRTNTFGGLYSDTLGPIAVGTANAVKKGEACSSSILGIIATGDASIQAAKASVGITKVATVDFSAMNVLGFYAKTCTIVRGE